MSEIRDILNLLDEEIQIEDSFDFELSEDLVIETGVVGLTEDAIIVEADDETIGLLETNGITLDEGDILKGPWGNTAIKTSSTAPVPGQPKAPVTMLTNIDSVQLYKEFIRKISPTLIKNEDDFLTQAYNFLRSKEYGSVNPKVLYDIAERMLTVYQNSQMSKTTEGHDELDEKMVMGLPGDQGSKVMGEGHDELDEIANLAGIPTVGGKTPEELERMANIPTVQRIKSGETEPVDRTDYNVPPGQRTSTAGMTGPEIRRQSLIKQGMIKAKGGWKKGEGAAMKEAIGDQFDPDQKGLAPDQRPGYHDQYDDQATYKYALQIADAIKKDTGATVDINTGREAGGQRGTYQIVINPQPNNRLKGFLPDGDRGATPQNVTKAIAQWFRMFRSKNWRFDQPVQGQFVIGVPKGSGMVEQEMEESGLQAYLGKKKYGEKGMKALQQAGRDGASKEKMASLRAKYDKLDEGSADEPVEPDMDADDKRFDDIDEAKYHGKEVPLGKKLPGDVKKSKVYVRKPNGKIVKVNFGDKNMRIKKSNPKRRKSFRARHNCKNPGPRWKARYWSCRSW